MTSKLNIYYEEKDFNSSRIVFLAAIEHNLILDSYTLAPEMHAFATT
jgi:hypothetical protein